MAPRANWKDYLKLSLVSRAVFLFPTTSDRVRFNIINRETGNRVRHDVVDAETGEEVPQEDRVVGPKRKKLKRAS
jgi:DNA end-binding protein Ku